MADALGIAGLVANLFGVLILFFFGMPFRVPTGGETVLGIGVIDAAEKAQDARYRVWGWIGLFLVVTGAALQIVALLRA